MNSGCTEPMAYLVLASMGLIFGARFYAGWQVAKRVSRLINQAQAHLLEKLDRK